MHAAIVALVPTEPDDLTLAIMPCPTWCVVDHEEAPAGDCCHAGPVLARPVGVQLWRGDRPGDPPRIFVGAADVDATTAREVAIALLQAAEELDGRGWLR